ncbi:uncharacterized protein V1516DRAFT_695974 [Lipomyces oligophaga]|uniref:uncharacterized protein n=1 Tax=Lipomyces oligophaga TaxID=45792 RepID=UPI0034CE047E
MVWLSRFRMASIRAGAAAAGPSYRYICKSRFDNVFLRDTCTCSICVDPSSGQKHFSTGEIPLDVHPKSTTFDKADDSVTITWTAAGTPDHVSRYSTHFLEQYSSPLLRYNAHWKFDVPELLWNQQNLGPALVRRDYADYLEDDRAFADIVLALYSCGMAFITGAPAAEKALDGEIVVEKIAQKIGYIKQTFYGKSWDVISIPDAKNIAYTSVNLPLHMDLLYYESPPGIQLLHCISNNAEGGESVYADCYNAASYIYNNDLEAFKVLCSFPIVFHYDNDGHKYMCTRPLIELDPFYQQLHPLMPPYRIKCMNYSPPFQAPFEHFISQSDLEQNDLTENGEFRKFLHAYKLFESIIHSPSEQYEEKFEPGVIALFMNRRVLHSRREFKLATTKQETQDLLLSGRWLKGTYLDIDSFYSKLRVLSALK